MGHLTIIVTVVIGLIFHPAAANYLHALLDPFRKMHSLIFCSLFCWEGKQTLRYLVQKPTTHHVRKCPRRQFDLLDDAGIQRLRDHLEISWLPVFFLNKRNWY